MEAKEIVTTLLEHIFDAAFDACKPVAPKKMIVPVIQDGGGDKHEDKDKYAQEENENQMLTSLSTSDFFPEENVYTDASEEPICYSVLFDDCSLEDPSVCLYKSDDSLQEISSPQIQRSSKFAFFTDNRAVEMLADDPLILNQGDFEVREEFDDDINEETRRRVYWSGPGLLQERHVRSLFQSQAIPEGVRPTLAYVSSEEMMPVEHPTTKAVLMTPPPARGISYQARKSDSKKIKKPLAKRFFFSILKAVGIKNNKVSE
ncbi:uncharacterized protein LOC106666009 [Cimex lectularius]|uniref:Uncharacterized protein n=1 Tax=Cimex lectularius TaxID=79782 RepID=A0A8I6RQP7_CIMLE|nr:uncharacterized protein LOC106666009 [Cimex lectularius]